MCACTEPCVGASLVGQEKATISPSSSFFTTLPWPLPFAPPTLAGHALGDARHFGWDVSEDVTHSWSKMVEGVQNHIGSLNWGYRVALRDKNVKYINALATLEDAHTIKVRGRGRERERKRESE